MNPTKRYGEPGRDKQRGRDRARPSDNMNERPQRRTPIHLPAREAAKRPAELMRRSVDIRGERIIG
jgi:hypothetical protein